MSDDLAFPKRKPPPQIAKAKKRQSRSETLTLAIMFQQLAEQGIVLKCGCGCGEPVEFGNHRGEHIKARELCSPGEDPDRPENQRYWRKNPCSLAKDKIDIKNIAKGKRIRGETKQGPKKKIASPGFQTNRDSKMKAKFGGGSVPRQ